MALETYLVAKAGLYSCSASWRAAQLTAGPATAASAAGARAAPTPGKLANGPRYRRPHALELVDDRQIFYLLKGIIQREFTRVKNGISRKVFLSR